MSGDRTTETGDPSPATPEQRAVRVLYCNLMYEIKQRIDVTVKLHAGQYNLPEQYAFELCYLQLRMICELIALACLAVHGDSPGTRTAKMRSAHEADFILNALEKLHPTFYPEPGVPVAHPGGGEAFVPSTTDYMTKPELVQLYWKCGELLHRGDFEMLRKSRALDFDAIQTAISKVIELLKFHKIALFGSDYELWFTMDTPGTDKVTATLRMPISNK